jgi:hypothetical protein
VRERCYNSSWSIEAATRCRQFKPWGKKKDPRGLVLPHVRTHVDLGLPYVRTHADFWRDWTDLPDPCKHRVLCLKINRTSSPIRNGTVTEDPVSGCKRKNLDDSSELLIGHFSKLCDDADQKSFNETSLPTKSTCPEESAASANMFRSRYRHRCRRQAFRRVDHKVSYV